MLNFSQHSPINNFFYGHYINYEFLLLHSFHWVVECIIGILESTGNKSTQHSAHSENYTFIQNENLIKLSSYQEILPQTTNNQIPNWENQGLDFA